MSLAYVNVLFMCFGNHPAASPCFSVPGAKPCMLSRCSATWIEWAWEVTWMFSPPKRSAVMNRYFTRCLARWLCLPLRHAHIRDDARVRTQPTTKWPNFEIDEVAFNFLRIVCLLPSSSGASGAMEPFCFHRKDWGLGLQGGPRVENPRDFF